MNPSLAAAIKSKETYRVQLADRPILEKLRLLDELRERDMLLHSALNLAKLKKNNISG